MKIVIHTAQNRSDSHQAQTAEVRRRIDLAAELQGYTGKYLVSRDRLAATAAISLCMLICLEAIDTWVLDQCSLRAEVQATCR